MCRFLTGTPPKDRIRLGSVRRLLVVAMSPEDIRKAIDDAIRQHELRVALWSGLLGLLFMAGTWRAIWLAR
jgi:hypothetical protein